MDHLINTCFCDTSALVLQANYALDVCVRWFDKANVSRTLADRIPANPLFNEGKRGSVRSYLFVCCLTVVVVVSLLPLPRSPAGRVCRPQPEELLPRQAGGEAPSQRAAAGSGPHRGRRSSAGLAARTHARTCQTYMHYVIRCRHLVCLLTKCLVFKILITYSD